MLHQVQQLIDDDNIDDSHYGLSSRERLGKRSQLRLNYNLDSSDDQLSDHSSDKVKHDDGDDGDDDGDGGDDYDISALNSKYGITSDHPLFDHNEHHFDFNAEDDVPVTAFNYDDVDSDLSESGDSLGGQHDPLSVTDLTMLANTQRALQSKRDRASTRRSRPIQLLSNTLDELIGLLQIEETPMEAITRSAPSRSKSKIKASKLDGVATAKKEAAFKLTGLCNSLINTYDIANAYDMTREQYLRLYQEETGMEYKRGIKRAAGLNHSEDEDESNHMTPIPNYGNKVWEFRWLDDDKVYGPFSDYEMAHWKISYFENNVEVRKVTEQEFREIQDVEFDIKI